MCVIKNIVSLKTVRNCLINFTLKTMAVFWYKTLFQQYKSKFPGIILQTKELKSMPNFGYIFPGNLQSSASIQSLLVFDYKMSHWCLIKMILANIRSFKYHTVSKVYTSFVRFL